MESSKRNIFPFQYRYPISNLVRDPRITCNTPVVAYPQLPCPREELPILMEAYRHDPVRGVEGFFDAITMVHINVDVQDTIVISNTVVKLCPLHRMSNPYLSNSKIPSTMSAGEPMRGCYTPLVYEPYRSRSRIRLLRSSSRDVNHQPNLLQCHICPGSAERHPLQ